MYHDNIIYKKKSNDPRFLLGVAVVLFLGSYVMNLGNSALSHFLQPLLGAHRTASARATSPSAWGSPCWAR